MIPVDHWERLILQLSTLLMGEVLDLMDAVKDLPPLYRLDQEVPRACAQGGFEPAGQVVGKSSRYAQIRVANFLAGRLALNFHENPLFQYADLEMIGAMVDPGSVSPGLDEEPIMRLVSSFVVFHRALLQALLSSLGEDLYESMERVNEAFFEAAAGRKLQDFAGEQLRSDVLAALSITEDQWRQYGRRVHGILVSYLPMAMRATVSEAIDRWFVARWEGLPRV